MYIVFNLSSTLLITSDQGNFDGTWSRLDGDDGSQGSPDLCETAIAGLLSVVDEKLDRCKVIFPSHRHADAISGKASSTWRLVDDVVILTSFSAAEVTPSLGESISSNQMEGLRTY